MLFNSNGCQSSTELPGEQTGSQALRVVPPPSVNGCQWFVNQAAEAGCRDAENTGRYFDGTDMLTEKVLNGLKVNNWQRALFQMKYFCVCPFCAKPWLLGVFFVCKVVLWALCWGFRHWTTILIGSGRLYTKIKVILSKIHLNKCLFSHYGSLNEVTRWWLSLWPTDESLCICRTMDSGATFAEKITTRGVKSAVFPVSASVASKP